MSNPTHSTPGGPHMQTYGPRHLLNLFRHTPWAVFAAIAALFIGVIGAGLLFYPNVYTLSKGYVTLAKLVPAKVMGAALLSPAVWVWMMAERPSTVPAVMLMALGMCLMFLCSLASVGLSGGTILYFLLFGLSAWAFYGSGGIRRQRSP